MPNLVDLYFDSRKTDAPPAQIPTDNRSLVDKFFDEREKPAEVAPTPDSAREDFGAGPVGAFTAGVQAGGIGRLAARALRPVVSGVASVISPLTGVSGGEVRKASEELYNAAPLYQPKGMAEETAHMAGTFLPDFPLLGVGGGVGGAVVKGLGVGAKAGGEAAIAALKAAKTAKEVKTAFDVARQGTTAAKMITNAGAFAGLQGGRTAINKALDTPGSEDQSVLEELGKGVLFGSTIGAAGKALEHFVPAAKTYLGGIGIKAPVDATLLTVAGNVYDHAVHGQPLDLKKMVSEIIGTATGFMLFNAAGGIVGRNPKAKPTAQDHYQEVLKYSGGQLPEIANRWKKMLETKDKLTPRGRELLQERYDAAIRRMDELKKAEESAKPAEAAPAAIPENPDVLAGIQDGVVVPGAARNPQAEVVAPGPVENPQAKVVVPGVETKPEAVIEGVQPRGDLAAEQQRLEAQRVQEAQFGKVPIIGQEPVKPPLIQEVYTVTKADEINKVIDRYNKNHNLSPENRISPIELPAREGPLTEADIKRIDAQVRIAERRIAESEGDTTIVTPEGKPAERKVSVVASEAASTPEAALTKQPPRAGQRVLAAEEPLLTVKKSETPVDRGEVVAAGKYEPVPSQRGAYPRGAKPVTTIFPARFIRNANGKLEAVRPQEADIANEQTVYPDFTGAADPSQLKASVDARQSAPRTSSLPETKAAGDTPAPAPTRGAAVPESKGASRSPAPPSTSEQLDLGIKYRTPKGESAPEDNAAHLVAIGLRLKDGRVIEAPIGTTHEELRLAAINAMRTPTERLGILKAINGYIDNLKRFVTGGEAKQIALQSDQLTKKTSGLNDRNLRERPVVERSDTRAPTSDLVKIVKNNPEGFTVGIEDGSWPTGGYAVAPVKATETAIDSKTFDQAALDSFLLKHYELASMNGAKLGGWLKTETGQYILDISFVLDDKQEALRVGKWGSQEAIYGVKEGKQFPVPADFNAGTPTGSNAAYAQARQRIEGAVVGAGKPDVHEGAQDALRGVGAEASGERASPGEAVHADNEGRGSGGDEVVRLIHYARKPLDFVDPAFHGGLPGAERKRRDAFPDEFVSRSYFGVKDKYQREAGLGHHEHNVEVPASKLFDLSRDDKEARKLQAKAKRRANEDYGMAPYDLVLNLYEREIKKAGYAGIINPEDNVVAMFHKVAAESRVTGGDEKGVLRSEPLAGKGDRGVVDRSGGGKPDNAPSAGKRGGEAEPVNPPKLRTPQEREVPLTEALRDAPKIDDLSARRIVNRILGPGADVGIVDRLFENGSERLGKYHNGFVTIVRRGNMDRTAWHESFHAAEDLLMTDAERRVLLKMEPNAERRADAFMEYATDNQGFKGALKGMFYRMMYRMKNLFGAANGVDELRAMHARVLDGYYGRRGVAKTEAPVALGAPAYREGKALTPETLRRDDEIRLEGVERLGGAETRGGGIGGRGGSGRRGGGGETGGVPEDSNMPEPERRTAGRTPLRLMLQAIRDYFTLDPVPMATRAGVQNEMVAHAAAKQSVQPMVNDIVARVFPDAYKNTPEAQAIREQTMSDINADNILGIYDNLVRKIQEATQKGDNAELNRLADMRDAIAEVHDLDALDAQVRQAQADPRRSEYIHNWEREVVPMMDSLYKEVLNYDPEASLPARGRHFKSRVNLLSKVHAEQWESAMRDNNADMPDYVPSENAASYKNPNVRRDKFARTAKGTGEYSTDPYQILTASIGPRYNEATKLRLYNKLVDQGVAKWSEPGSMPPQMDGKPMARLPVKVPVNGKQTEKTLFVRPDLVHEIRDVLATDMGQKAPAWARALTQVQLAQLVDLVTHAKNIQAQITRAQGAGSAWKDIVRKMPVFGSIDAVRRILDVTREVLADTPEIRKEIAELSKIGVMRQHFPSTGLQKITRGQEFLWKMDTASRIILNRFYSNLVERGLMPDTVEGRRNYINQVGQYNGKLMTPFMRAMRQYGFAPFIVAGRNFNLQGLRSLSGYAGTKGTSASADMTMRGINLLGTGLLFTIPAMLNTLTTGNPGGRPGTPVGAWDLGTDEDDGKHKVFDLLQLTGVRRGMRLTGMNAMINGWEEGLPINMSGGKAVQDSIQSMLHPWMGPAVGFAVKAGLGVQPDVRGKFAPMRIKDGGLAQIVENFRAAIESQNPSVYSIVEPALKASGIDRKPDVVSTPKNIADQLFLRPISSAAGFSDAYDKASAGVQLAASMVYGESPETRTQQEMERTQARMEYTQALRSGTATEVPSVLSKRQKSDAVKAAMQTAELAYAHSVLNRLEASDVFKVWPLLTADEQLHFRPMIIAKINNRIKETRDPNERAALFEVKADIFAGRTPKSKGVFVKSFSELPPIQVKEEKNIDRWKEDQPEEELDNG